jgi:UDP-glucose 4-epimerase
VDLKPSPFTHQVGDISDQRFVERCMKGVRAVVHAATLHKPHVATHSWQAFIDANVTGTLTVLEAAAAAGVGSFVYISTTSVFGSALSPPAAEPAAWVTESVLPQPRNIYGTTKLMAEALCELVHRQRRLPVLVLRTSRFFPEEDDNAAIRRHYEMANVQANELLYRRVDVEDIVTAILSAVEKAPRIGHGRFIISATTPFIAGDLETLRKDAPRTVRRLYPECDSLYAARNWKLFPQIDRVYVNELARRVLEWQPRYDFAYVLECLRHGRDFRSALAREVGSKGYHARSFADGPYPVG